MKISNQTNIALTDPHWKTMMTGYNDSRMATKSEVEEMDEILLHQNNGARPDTGSKDVLDPTPSPAMAIKKAQPEGIHYKERLEPIRVDQTQIGGPINRFLLCSLVSKAARQLKMGKFPSQESSSVTMIGRRVLKSYLKAGMDPDSPLNESGLDVARLGILNKQIVLDELLDQAQRKVKESRVRYAESQRSGDEARVKSDQNKLSGAIAHRDWLTGKLTGT